MARGRKGGPTRMDLRREAEAVEARDREETTETDGEAEEEEADDEEPDDADADAEASDDDGDEDSPKPKSKAKAKKKAEPKAKKAPVKRTRTPKEVRMKAIWVVFDNSGKRVKEFPYPNKAQAEALLAERIEEKKGTFYVQLVKEPLES